MVSMKPHPDQLQHTNWQVVKKDRPKITQNN